MLAMVTGLDRAIGRIIESFKKYGKYKNTIFAFASDNGGSLTYRANNMPFRSGMRVNSGHLGLIWGQAEVLFEFFKVRLPFLGSFEVNLKFVF